MITHTQEDQYQAEHRLNIFVLFGAECADSFPELKEFL